ncbi:MAG: phosphotransferase [Acidimicrobiales bacterium]
MPTLNVAGGAEEALSGGSQSDAHRAGDVVLRSAKPQSRTIMALLAHLHDVGFDAAPRPVGGGFAPDGREQLHFIEGQSPQPDPWSDEAVWHIGHLLRRLHDATSTFSVPDHAFWHPWFARTLPGNDPVIGHGDLGPWNILAREGLPVAFIDWDYAGPVDAMWELAEVAWLNAQLHDDDVAARHNLPDPDARARQLGLIVDGYGVSRQARHGFVDRMIEFAIRSAREDAIEYAVGPETPSPAPNGFPILWGITWRSRAAAWLLDHRRLLESALRY